MLATPSTGVPMIAAYRAFDPDQNPYVTNVETALNAGRGPPRAGPHIELSSPPHAWPRNSFSAAPRFPSLPGTCNATDTSVETDGRPPRGVRACSHIASQQTGRPSGRSHDRRLEGTAAWSVLPSFGGFS
jgi:hypothetical protein